MSEEFYRKYRPQHPKEVVGQQAAVAMLGDMIKRKAIPHALLFTGPSGCGKTTLARILRTRLGCSDHDFDEINSADCRGIDEVRKIRSRIGIAPMAGKCRVWLIDECHAMTGDAQNALLKILEDTPKHVYFMLATTDPQKLKKTIITRCTEIKCKALSEKDIAQAIKDVLKKAEREVDESVILKIARVADGSARKALVILHQVVGLATKEEQMAAIESGDVKGQAIKIAQGLINGMSWKEMAGVLSTVEEDPESIRYMILGYCKKVLLGAGPKSSRAAMVIDVFGQNFYDSKDAGLAAACYEILKA